MLGANSQSQHSSRNSTQDWKLPQQLEWQRKTPHRFAIAQSAANKPTMRENLKPLSHLGWKFPAFLDLMEQYLADRPMQQGLRQDICRGNRVLDREIDAHSADRRHGMSTVPDAKQPRPRPPAKPVDRNR